MPFAFTERRELFTMDSIAKMLLLKENEDNLNILTGTFIEELKYRTNSFQILTIFKTLIYHLKTYCVETLKTSDISSMSNCSKLHFQI